VRRQQARQDIQPHQFAGRPATDSTGEKHRPKGERQSPAQPQELVRYADPYDRIRLSHEHVGDAVECREAREHGSDQRQTSLEKKTCVLVLRQWSLALGRRSYRSLFYGRNRRNRHSASPGTVHVRGLILVDHRRLGNVRCLRRPLRFGRSALQEARPRGTEVAVMSPTSPTTTVARGRRLVPLIHKNLAVLCIWLSP